jgi:hypothetical protein
LFFYERFLGRGITHKGQDAMPNFTDDQFEAYEARWKMNQGDTHTELEGLTETMLNNIFTFLKYRKH